jgi:cell division protein FtsI (penicillin-binding protein 3)
MKYVLQTMRLNFLDSTANSPFSNMYSTTYVPVVNARPLNKKTIPNVKGLGLKDALFLLENMNLKVIAKGRGKVVAQSIAPGTIGVRNQPILIDLN